MLWEELSAKDFESYSITSKGLCVVPMGVLEKHGDHLPLGTDMYIANEVAKTAAGKSPAVVFPYYFLGQISEALHVKGTIAPSHKLMMDALLEMCDEIHRNGFDKILLLSSHGGNVYFLPFFAQMLPGLNRPYAVYTHILHNLKPEYDDEIRSRTGMVDMGAHAGFYETALMMHLRPDLVHLNEVVLDESKDLGRLKSTKDAGLFTGFDWYASFPHHFAGNPTEATASYGEVIFDVLCKKTADLFDIIKNDNASLPVIKEYNDIANGVT